MKQIMKLMRCAIPAIIFLLCNQYQAKAVLVMHEWQKDHRGYSIEQVPGTGVPGTPARFVAAGTIYEAAKVGWHWMHLDDNGNVIMERATWSTIPHQVEFRVVDIACQSGAEIWITIQVRDKGGLDYIYIAGIDIVGNDLPSPRDAIAIRSINTTHNNLYPTHTFFADNSLFICGYAADGTEFPNEPDPHYSDKWGMMLKCYVNAATPYTATYFWNTPNTGGPDFDMALKIAPNSHGSTFPLLVTGAVNTTADHWTSGVLAAKIDINGFPSKLQGLIPAAHYATPIPNRPSGVYGVDIRGGMRGGMFPQTYDDNDNDNLILVNYYDEYQPQNRTYGVLRTHNDFTAYPWTINSYKYVIDDYVAWGKQFLEMHGYEGQSQNNSPEQIDNHINIVGEQFDQYSQCSPTYPSGTQPLSLTNINPFLRMLKVGNSHWSYTAGFLPLGEGSPIVYLSALGTTSTSMDYLQGSLGAGAIREDITRLYTFANVSRFYDDPTLINPPQPDPVMLLPVGSTATPWLSTKYLGIQNSTWVETSCQKQIWDCPQMDYSFAINTAVFSRPGFVDPETNPAYWYFGILPVPGNMPPQNDCSTGFYRSTAIVEKNNSKTMEIFPNPVTDELNIRTNENSGSYSFSLADITGKVVVKTEGDLTGEDIKVQLSLLNTGMYIATISINGKNYIEKVSIQ